MTRAAIRTQLGLDRRGREYFGVHLRFQAERLGSKICFGAFFERRREDVACMEGPSLSSHKRTAKTSQFVP